TFFVAFESKDLEAGYLVQEVSPDFTAQPGRPPWRGREEAHESIRFRLRLFASTLQLSHHGERKTSTQRSGCRHRHLCRLSGLWQGISLRLDGNEDGPLRA